MKTPKAPSRGLATIDSPKQPKNTTHLKPKSCVPAVGRSWNTIVAVLRRLDIDPDEIKLIPTEPAEILIRCFGNGNLKEFPRKKVFAYIAASPQPVCQKFITTIQSITKLDSDKLSFEAMCVYAKVNPLELLGAILMSAKSMKATESALKAILAHPDVVQETIDSAKSGDPVMANGAPLLDKDGNLIRYRGDIAAQRIIHEATGFLPSKKGGGIEINFGFGRPAEERDEDSDADDDWDKAFPPLGDAVQGWSQSKHLLLEGEKKK
jgi:hypothetical protein